MTQHYRRVSRSAYGSTYIFRYVNARSWPHHQELTPKEMMTRNILKNTRKITLLANASGMIPRNVVAAPTITDGPISPSALAILTSFDVFGSYKQTEVGTPINKRIGTQVSNAQSSSCPAVHIGSTSLPPRDGAYQYVRNWDFCFSRGVDVTAGIDVSDLGGHPHHPGSKPNVRCKPSQSLIIRRRRKRPKTLLGVSVEVVLQCEPPLDCSSEMHVCYT